MPNDVSTLSARKRDQAGNTEGEAAPHNRAHIPGILHAVQGHDERGSGTKEGFRFEDGARAQEEYALVAASFRD